MSVIIFTHIFLLLSTSKPVLLGKYCHLQCGAAHTVCRRAMDKCGPSDFCGYNSDLRRLTNKERYFLLHQHNLFRSKIATGTHPAANMNVFSYNMELEFIAQCWANNCRYMEDTCRATQEFSTPGQNIFQTKLTRTPLEKAMDFWSRNWQYLNTYHIKLYQENYAKNISYLTQLVWAETTHIGCGVSRYSIYIFIVCNYGPGGNIEGEPVYQIGSSCTKCKAVCNREYKGLCGLISQPKHFNEPFQINCGPIFQKIYIWLILVCNQLLWM